MSATHALIANAGTKGQIYPEFTPFLAIEVELVALYILQGLNPSPYALSFIHQK
jgi:hypothetical protein